MAVNTIPKLDKTAFSVISLEENDLEEKAYWLSKTPFERLDALETMRQIIYGYDPTTTRLQRVLKLLKGHNVRYLLIGGYRLSWIPARYG